MSNQIVLQQSILSFRNSFLHSPSPYLLPALRAWAHVECASHTHVRSRAIYHARSRDGPRLVPPRRRDNEEDSSFHGNLRYTFMVAVRLYATSPGSEAQREISFQPCFLAATRSDESVFPPRYRGNFAIHGWKKVKPVNVVQTPDFSIFFLWSRRFRVDVSIGNSYF